MAGPVKQSEYTVEPPDQSQEYTVEAPAATPPPAQTPTPVPAMNRFGSSAASGLGIVSPEEGKNFFTHPIDTAASMLTANRDLGNQAFSELKTPGKRIQGASDLVYSAIPFLGPAMAHGGHQLAEGDTAGGLGTMAGLGAGIVAGHAMTPSGSVATAPANGVPGTMGTIKSPSVGIIPKIDPNAAISDALHVPPKSPKMGAAIRDVEGSRPYLQGARTQADLQQRVPQAKAEIWKPYQEAIDRVGQRPIQGPEGPTTAADLERQRVEVSAQQQALKKLKPTDQQTLLQQNKAAAELDQKYKAITSALDPVLEQTGINPKTIRDTFGSVKGVERNISGKSTVSEASQPYGFRKMFPYGKLTPFGPKLSWSPLEGINDIRQGQYLSGKPTDVGVRRAFSSGGPKPDLGTVRTNPVAGLLPAAPIELGSPMEPIGPPSTPQPVAPATRAVRKGLMLPETGVPRMDMKSSLEPLGEPSPPPSIEPTTRAQRKGLLLPERAGGPHPMQEYGYSAPDSAGEVPKMEKYRPGKKIGETRQMGGATWRWDGEKWAKGVAENPPTNNAQTASQNRSPLPQILPPEPQMSEYGMPQTPRLQRFQGGGGSVYDPDVMGTINRGVEEELKKKKK